MTTSGPVVAGRYASTLWTYPVSGTFEADRTRLIGNVSAADGQVGVNLGRVLSLPPVENLGSAPVGLDGVDYTDSVFDQQTVVVPVVIYQDTPWDALAEWRRIVGALSPAHRRAALEVTDPQNEALTDPNIRFRRVRWLRRLVLSDMDDQPLQHDRQNYFVGRLVFVTDGEPWWTPDVNDLGPGQTFGYVWDTVNPTDNSVYQMSIPYPGDQGAWPYVEWLGLAGRTISLTLAATGQQVDIVDTLTGTAHFDFDRRTRDPATDKMIAPYSQLFQIPPTNPTRVDVVIGGGTPSGATVRMICLPRYSTA